MGVQNIMWFTYVSTFLIDVLTISINDAQHKGMYTRGLSEAEITLPTRVTEKGEHLSHNVTHFHDGEPVHYNITLLNETKFLILNPREDFLSPHLVIERHKRDLHTRKKITMNKCHYRGIIHGEPNSVVAMSSCNGLAGLIKINNEEYWIEPVHHEVKRVQPGHKHLIFRRSAIDSKTAKRKRKRKKKKHHLKNCGTREPKRYTETEWIKMGKIKVQGKKRNKIKNNILSQKKMRQRNGKRHSRKPRSVSRPRYVETLLVADNSMYEFHEEGEGDVEQYLLTIMNMVSSLYLDPSIGNSVNVVVVKIILQEEILDYDFTSTVNADFILKDFCKWQENLNPKNEDDPHHHDVAILVTRQDICARKNKPCSTLGVAHVGGMCHKEKSCSVNEDNGITLAHTITHEMGHNFGMYHDTEKTGCHRKEGHTMHVMTPSFEADAIGVSWSRCSRRDITNFFDQGLGRCLDDKPQTKNYSYPDLPPGAMYNAKHQCRLQFGSTAEVCSLHEICSRLWCVIDDTCTSLLRPAAPGTHCGKHMWCQNQECVPIVEKPIAIDGGWGDWSEWSECSRSCGAGVSIQQRDCDHPKPASGGKFCIGERRRYRICNTNPCPEDQPTFRAIQCSKFNNHTYNGTNYTWLPYFDLSEPCELYCTDVNDTVIVPWGEHAEDGTPCNARTRDVCISGICRKVGCDWMVDSDATEDACGICQGDGSQCNIIQEIYNEIDLNPGYKEIKKIPIGSKKIFVEEMDNSDNYLCIKSANSTKYYLNGNRQITLGGEYDVAGTQALYERNNNELDRIYIEGPIKEDIVICMFVSSTSTLNPGVWYRYTVTKQDNDETKEEVYVWSLSEWSSCSATCGGGIQTRGPKCQNENGDEVDLSMCPLEGQPDKRIRKCHVEPCPSKWWVGPWQSCPVTCQTKGEKRSMRKRSVMCIDGREYALPEEFCDNSTRPTDQEPCNTLPRCSETR